MQIARTQGGERRIGQGTRFGALSQTSALGNNRTAAVEIVDAETDSQAYDEGCARK
jgi:hypothetical protein